MDADETVFRVFDIASQTIIVLGQEREIQRKISPNFIIIKITSPNLLDCSDFLCFLFIN